MQWFSAMLSIVSIELLSKHLVDCPHTLWFSALTLGSVAVPQPWRSKSCCLLLLGLIPTPNVLVWSAVVLRISRSLPSSSDETTGQNLGSVHSVAGRPLGSVMTIILMIFSANNGSMMRLNPRFVLLLLSGKQTPDSPHAGLAWMTWWRVTGVSNALALDSDLVILSRRRFPLLRVLVPLLVVLVPSHTFRGRPRVLFAMRFQRSRHGCETNGMS
jgi:hypothetical protein